MVTEACVSLASHVGFRAFFKLSVLGHENYEHVILVVYRVVGCALLAPHTVLVWSDSSVLKQFTVDHFGVL